MAKEGVCISFIEGGMLQLLLESGPDMYYQRLEKERLSKMSRNMFVNNRKTRILSMILVVIMLSLTGIFYPTISGFKALGATVSEVYQLDSRVRINSIGFLPNLQKKATIAASCTRFELVKEDGTVVFSGTTTPMYDGDSGENVNIADFSSVTEEGTYYLGVPGVGKSVNFRIAKDVYNEAYKTSMLGMYLWRCGTEVSATYDGNHFSHAACHTQDAYLDYITNQHTIKDGKKGWHDAGDYNKYVVNAGITVGAMFLAWEQFQDKIEPVALTMPESSNSMPDFLDEMKFEIDWLLTMQYPDGSGKVAHKLSTRSFGGFIMPENETTERFFTPWGSAATADFVAMTAMAARIFRPYDPQYADKCINAAKVSYAFLKANPNNHSPDQSAFSTGGYNTGDSDDRLWAAAEMWATLGDATYLNDFESRVSSFSPKVQTDFDWGSVGNLGMITYLLSERTGKNQAIVDSIKRDLISAADSIVATSKNHGYGRTLGSRYYWGCNGTVARQTMVLQTANMISPKTDYLNAAVESLGHVFGRNYYNRSYVTGLGINPPMFPHDRRAGADGIADPWPGYLVGGGHSAKGWVDVEASYETNEIAINWNGALIYALAGFVDQGGSTPDIIYGDLNGDGDANSTDLTVLKRYVLKINTTFSVPNGEKAADLNVDGSIDSTDITILKRFILKIVTSLPLVS